MNQSGERIALVIGINTYIKDNQGNNKYLQDLAAPARDAEAIAKKLEEYGGFRVTRLPAGKDKNNADNKNPVVSETRQVKSIDLLDEIKKLFLPKASQNEIPKTALLFFAGHGVPEENSLTEEHNSYLAASDTDLKQTWGIKLSDLRILLNKSSIKEQIVWLDCCHSGDLLNFEQDLEQLNNSKPDYNRCFITACCSYEEALAHKDGHGILTESLLKGLNPETKQDGWVTSKTLGKFVEQDLKQTIQRPRFAIYGEAIWLTNNKLKVNNSAQKICPYRGLDYFGVDDARWFFGRDSLIDELIPEIKTKNFLAILGASGIGKSSILRAGLIPVLQQGTKIEGSESWEIYLPFTPSDAPIKEWENSLKQSIDELTKKLKEDINEERLLIFIDQFEECFTHCQPDERKRFFNLLVDIVNTTSSEKICLVLAMRIDFMIQCNDYVELHTIIKNNHLIVGAMNEKELRAAITGAEKDADIQIEENLVNTMVEEVLNSPGSLPLLQYTLKQLWNLCCQQRNIKELTYNAYTELGGLKKALNNEAERIYNTFANIIENSDIKKTTNKGINNKQALAQRIFLSLTNIGEKGTENTRRRVNKNGLIIDQKNLDEINELSEVLNTLRDARLITIDTIQIQEDIIIDIVHESLIRYWDRLGKWIDEHRDCIRITRNIEYAAQIWKDKGKLRNRDFLYQGSRLKEAEKYLTQANNIEKPNSLAQEFITLSREIEQEEDEKKDQQIEMQKRLITQYELREQAGKVYNLINQNPVNALNLAVELTIKSQEELNEVSSSILDCLRWAIETIREQNRWQYQTKITVIAITSSQEIMTGSQDGTIGFRDLKGNLIQEITHHQDEVTAVACSSNGDLAVSGSKDRKLAFWNLQTKQVYKELLADYCVTAIAISPDEKTIVSGYWDGSLKIFNSHGKSISDLLKEHKSPVTTVKFLPDGRFISGSRDRSLLLWSSQGELIDSVSGVHSDWISSVDVHPQGKLAISAGVDGKICLWNIQDQELTLKIQFSTSDKQIFSVAFSYDGQWILSTAPSVIRLWNLQGREIFPFQGHQGKVHSAIFTNDKNPKILSISDDKSLRLWRIARSPLSYQFPFDITIGTINSLAFSPNSQKIVSGSDDGTIRLWSLQGELLFCSEYHSSVRSVAFSPVRAAFSVSEAGGQCPTGVGHKIVGAIGETVALWKLEDNSLSLIQDFDHQSTVNSVLFIPHSPLIVSCSDQDITVWNYLEGKSSSFFQNNSKVNSVAFIPNQQQIVSGSDDGIVRRWSLQGELLSSFKHSQKKVTSVACSPNGQQIISGSDDGTLGLWNLQGELLIPFFGHEQKVNSVAFSPVSAAFSVSEAGGQCPTGLGQQIVSASDDKTLCLWDLKGIKIGPPFHQHSEKVTSVAFSPDGKWIISGGRDKKLILWEEHSWQSCLKRARNLLSQHSDL